MKRYTFFYYSYKVRHNLQIAKVTNNEVLIFLFFVRQTFADITKPFMDNNASPFDNRLWNYIKRFYPFLYKFIKIMNFL